MSYAKKRKPFRVLVIDENKDVRQALADYYSEKLEHRYASGGRSTVYRAMTVDGAEKKILADFIADKYFGLVVFSNNFPETQRDWLIKELSYSRISVPFISVPLRSQAQATQALVAG